MTPPLPNREALEKASAILRKGKCPPKHAADRIADALDAMALAIALAGDPVAFKPVRENA